MPASRRRLLKRFAVVAIGTLFFLVGAQQLAALGQNDSRRHHHREHRVEHRIEKHGSPHVRRSSHGRDVVFAETFAVREGDRLAVDLTDERVEIRPARGLEATVTVRARGDRARRSFESKRFTADYRSDTLRVRTDPPRGWRPGRSGDGIVVVIEVPARFSATVDVASGDVQVDELNGDLSVDTGSGTIAVGAVRGDRISLDTGSGSVRADLLEGVADVGTGSGSIDVGTAIGRFSADTGSGSITVAEADVSSFAADTGSGSVSARLLRSATVDIDTGSGGVALTLPRASGANLHLDGGPIRIDEVLGFDGSSSRDRARGRVGSGGPEVRISTGSGGIEIGSR